MTEDESEVFEITDFTTASEWERFIAKVEEVIHEWRLSVVVPYKPLRQDEFSLCKWEEKSEIIDFAGFKFTVSRLSAAISIPNNGEGTENPEHASSRDVKGDDSEFENPGVWQDMMSIANDFPSRAHCLCRYYGLRDFVTLQPAPGMDDIMTESRANILLSSVAVAINNTACKVPIFVQVHSKWRRMYTGHFETPGFRTCFEMVHLKQAPKQYQHLTGLLDVFRAKLACAGSETTPVSVAVRFTYVLKEWPFYDWSQAPPDMDSLTGEEVGAGDFGVLPVGACTDPIEDLQLSVTWPRLSEEMIVDGDVYSDLNPLQAPHWSVKIRVTDNLQCLLGDYLEEFLELCKSTKSTSQLLGKPVTDSPPDEINVTSALDKLADTSYNLPTLGTVLSKSTTVVTRATAKLQIQPEEAPIPTSLLNEILLYLFPDAREDFLKNSGSQNKLASSEKLDVQAKTPESAPEKTDLGNKLDTQQDFGRQLKCAPVESVTHRLAVVMAVLNHSYGGVRAAAHLWQEFVLEMRYRWENNHPVTDIEPGSPNMGCSLLHQKLQMFNCCIERKKARETSSNLYTCDLELYDPRDEPCDNAQTSCAQNQSKSNDRTTDTAKQSSTTTKKPSAENDRNQTTEKQPEKRKRTSTNSVKESTKDVVKTESGWEMETASLSSEDEFYECEENTVDNVDVSESLPSDKEPTATDQLHTDAKSEKKLSTSDKNDTGNVDQSKENSDQIDQSSQISRDGLQQSSSCVSGLDSTSVSFTDVLEHQPEGRLQPCGELRMLGNEAQALYIPVTQEPAPMTEDMLDEHAEVLAKLGTTEEGMHLRARMQSASLLSDMESFKAANPSATLGDFVRWYSPRDWVVSEEQGPDGQVVKKGELSQRMQIPGNMWVEVWQSARPVPARRQRRLFDDTKEAEKVLHWLAAMNPADVAFRLMPMLVHAALLRLHDVSESQAPAVKHLLQQASHMAAKVLRAPRIDLHKCEELLRLLGHVEVQITRAQSLQQKLCHERSGVKEEDLQSFVSGLLERAEVNVEGAGHGPIGKIIHELFRTAQKAASIEEESEGEVRPTTTAENTQSSTPTHRPSLTPTTTSSDFPPPAGKEYILRTCAQRPAPWSRPSPQRMYSIWLHNEFRILGAFTTDTTFQ